MVRSILAADWLGFISFRLKRIAVRKVYICMLLPFFMVEKAEGGLVILNNIENENENDLRGVKFKFSETNEKAYLRAGYRIVGEHKHSGVEICHWTKSRLRGKKNCYKAAYGIKSHRCVQMTPTLDFCNLSCSHCWRTFGEDRAKGQTLWDDPKTIVDEAIEAQQKLLSGFGGNKNTTAEMFRQSMEPVHFAISLDGEPTLYPDIAGLVKEIRGRGATAFLVTNGTMPHKLREMLDKGAIPNNLYTSVYGASEDVFNKATNAKIPGLYERVMESLMLFPGFNKKGCRTIFRITAVKGTTLQDAEGYARLVRMSEPMFIEVKGYSFVGDSRMRLTEENVPTMKEIEDFGNQLIKHTGYILKYSDDDSRVVILVRDEDSWQRNLEMIKEQDRVVKATMVDE